MVPTPVHDAKLPLRVDQQSQLLEAKVTVRCLDPCVHAGSIKDR
jgi:hypothetical protein